MIIAINKNRLGCLAGSVGGEHDSWSQGTEPKPTAIWVWTQEKIFLR